MLENKIKQFRQVYNQHKDLTEFFLRTNPSRFWPQRLTQQENLLYKKIEECEMKASNYIDFLVAVCYFFRHPIKQTSVILRM